MTYGINNIDGGNIFMSNQSKKPGEDDKNVDPVVPEAIGKQLRRMYNDVADEPVPDRFSALLDQLAKQEQDKK